MSRFSRKQARLSKQREELYLKVDSFYENNIKFLENLLSYFPDENSEYCCSQCTKWQCGSSWKATDLGIVAEGQCSECGLGCNNIRKACISHFVKAPRNGFFYQSTGDAETDLNNVLNLTQEIIENNQ